MGNLHRGVNIFQVSGRGKQDREHARCMCMYVWRVDHNVQHFTRLKDTCTFNPHMSQTASLLCPCPILFLTNSCSTLLLPRMQAAPKGHKHFQLLFSALLYMRHNWQGCGSNS